MSILSFLVKGTMINSVTYTFKCKINLRDLGSNPEVNQSKCPPVVRLPRRNWHQTLDLLTLEDPLKSMSQNVPLSILSLE